MRTIGFVALPLLLLAACVDKPANTTTATTTGSTPVAAGISADWHATDTLFRLMGGVQGKTVADLFIGDGYYTLKLLEAGARVIAMDDDPRNVEALAAKARELGIGEDRLIIRTASPGTPNLSLKEVDLALCTRQFTGIPDQTNYFRKVKAAIKPPCQLFIVDFLPEQTPMGPPQDQRVSELQVMDAMEPAGFTDIGGYTRKLPYRFVVQAMDFVEGTPTDGPPVTVQAPL
jgi:predicted methyltransferase